MFELLTDYQWAALFGALGGIALGLAARLGRFCTLGAIEDALYSSSTDRLRMWGVALGIAIIGSFSAIQFGLLAPTDTFYLTQAFNPMAAIVGGLMFGYGMALSGNCGFGALARLGGGELRAFMIVIVMGISSYAALSGPLAALRIALFTPSPANGRYTNFPDLVHDFIGLGQVAAGLLIGLIILGIACISPAIKRTPSILFWGAIVGLSIVSGWIATHWIAVQGFGGLPVVTHTFSAPLGDALLYTMLSSGLNLSFGVGSVFGVVLGAVLGSLIKGHFRWEACDDPRELRRQILGAVLMGFGAVIASGCSIGQGLSAFSVLAFSAPLTLTAIFVGAAVGLRQLITGFSTA
jgi:uncharacterized membrane protein YedE/YeeE